MGVAGKSQGESGVSLKLLVNNEGVDSFYSQTALPVHLVPVNIWIPWQSVRPVYT